MPSGASSCQTTSVRLRFLLAEVLALHAVARAQQVLEEVLVALAGRTQQIGAPDKQIPRPVARMIGIGAAHLQRAVLQRLDHVFLRFQRRGLRIAHHLQRIRLQLRRRGEPTHALGAHVVIDHAAGVAFPVGQRREHLLHAELLVPPLVGVGVEEARAVLLAGRTNPVERERQRRPAGLRAQLFLPDVMRPAAAALADAAAHHQQVDEPR